MLLLLCHGFEVLLALSIFPEIDLILANREAGPGCLLLHLLMRCMLVIHRWLIVANA